MLEDYSVLEPRDLVGGWAVRVDGPAGQQVSLAAVLEDEATVQGSPITLSGRPAWATITGLGSEQAWGQLSILTPDGTLSVGKRQTQGALALLMERLPEAERRRFADCLKARLAPLAAAQRKAVVDILYGAVGDWAAARLADHEAALVERLEREKLEAVELARLTMKPQLQSEVER